MISSTIMCLRFLVLFLTGALFGPAQSIYGDYGPGVAFADLPFAERMAIVEQTLGGSAPFTYSFTDVNASANFYSRASANALNQGGIGGYTEFAASQMGEDLLDFFGTTAAQRSAMKSGTAAGAGRRGAAWGYGAVTAGMILMNAIPGEGKAAALTEEEGAKLLESKAEQSLFSKTSGEGMDPALFQRIQTAFERNGGVMQADEESARYLASRNAEGVTLGPDTILLPENPSTSAVYEELIHTAQLQAGMTDPLEMEIQAAQKLIRFADQYKIPPSETQQTINRLNALLQQRQ